MDNELVIKVSYGGTLRRFSVLFNESGSLDLDMSRLKMKIFDFFKFTPDTDLTITYVDEDNDLVTIVEEEDLRDAVKQRLNPLRLNVSLAHDNVGNGNRSGRSTPNSPYLNYPRYPFIPPPPPPAFTVSPNVRPVSVPPMRQPWVDPFSPFLGAAQLNPAPKPSHGTPPTTSSPGEAVSTQEQTITKLVQDLSSKVAAVAPEKYRDFVSKLSNDMMAKAAAAASPAPLLCEVIETLSKLAVTNDDATAKDHGVVSKMPSDVFGKSVPNNINDDLKASKNSLPTSEDVSRDDQPNIAANMTRSVGTSSSQNVTEDSRTPEIAYWNSVYPAKLSQNVNDNHGNLGSLFPSTFAATPLKGLAEEAPKNSVSAQVGGFGSINSRGHASSETGGIVFPQRSGLLTEQIRSAIPNATRRGFYPMPVGSRDGIKDIMGRVIHRGVCCDGCDVHPIIGSRYKSKVKEDYDLCSVCFAEMGTEADYIKMDHPVYYRSPRSIRLHHRKSEKSSPPRGFQTCGVRSINRHAIPLKHDSRFMEDVNVGDGTLVAPLTPFTKIWRMHNSGTSAWPHGSQLVWIGGDRLTNVESFDVEMPVEGCFPGNDLNIAVDFTAPALPGQYTSYWRLALPSGLKFGQSVWVLIQVDAPKKDSVPESGRNLNLNFPPNDSSDVKDQIIDMNIEPELAKPAEEKPTNMGQVYYNEIPTETPAPVVFPDIDFSSAPFEPIAVPVATQTSSSVEAKDKQQSLEESLLTELDSMGFKEIGLNKEVLRVNEYDLERALDHLCGVSEWDPMLEELQEMGFNDAETNRKLLIKNGGSIKRVVMDLIASEKA